LAAPMSQAKPALFSTIAYTTLIAQCQSLNATFFNMTFRLTREEKTGGSYED
jgi:hypothetical protein